MLADLPHDRLKSLMFFEDGYHEDKSLQIGKANAAHSGHRLNKLIAEIIEDRADYEDWAGGENGLVGRQSWALQALSADKAQEFGAEQREHWLVTISLTKMTSSSPRSAIGRRKRRTRRLSSDGRAASRFREC